MSSVILSAPVPAPASVLPVAAVTGAEAKTKSAGDIAAVCVKPASAGADVGTGWDNAYVAHGDGSAKVASLWAEDPIPVLPDIVRDLTAHARATHCPVQQLTVLDVGAGDGRNVNELMRNGFRCIAMDLSGVALERADAATQHTIATAAQTAAQTAAPAVAMAPVMAPPVMAPPVFVRGDCEALPFASGTVSAITCLDLFGQLPKPHAFVREANRVLRAGGRLYINAFTPDDETCGEGDRIDPAAESRSGGLQLPHNAIAYRYKGTLFRYFAADELASIIAECGMTLVASERRTWRDPPHGAFRPKAHTHVNWFVTAQKPAAPAAAPAASATAAEAKGKAAAAAPAAAVKPNAKPNKPKEQKHAKAKEKKADVAPAPNTAPFVARAVAPAVAPAVAAVAPATGAVGDGKGDSAPTHRMAVILSKNLPIGKALNAAAHMAAGAVNHAFASGAKANGQAEFAFTDFVTRDGVTYPSISARSFVVLKAPPNKLATTFADAQALAAEGVTAVAFTESMTGDTYVEQLARTAAADSGDTSFFGVALWGPKAALEPLTKKFSLYQ